MPPQHAVQRSDEDLIIWRLNALEQFQKDVLDKIDSQGNWVRGILGTLIVYLIVLVFQLLKKG